MQGYRAVLGVSLVGSKDKKYKMTAAALKLVNKENKVIWSAPQWLKRFLQLRLR